MDNPLDTSVSLSQNSIMTKIRLNLFLEDSDIQKIKIRALKKKMPVGKYFLQCSDIVEKLSKKQLEELTAQKEQS